MPKTQTQTKKAQSPAPARKKAATPKPKTSRAGLQRESKSATTRFVQPTITIEPAMDFAKTTTIGIELSQDLTMEVTIPVEKALEQKSLTLADRARAVTITDAVTYAQAGAMVKDVVSIRREVVEHYAPLKKAAFEAHRLVCEAESKFLSPVAEAERVLKQAIGHWDTEQARIDNERRRKALEADERRRAEEVRQATAQAQEKSAAEIERLMLDEGMSYEEAVEKVNPTAREQQAVASVPVARTVVMPAPKVQGVSTAPTYACIVDDLKELCGAVYRGEYTTECVLPNMAVLNGLARLMKQAFRVPGCSLLEGERVTVR